MSSPDEFMPSALPGAKQILDVAGLEFPVDLHYDSVNGRLRVKLVQHDSTVVSEEYAESPAAFSLVEAEDTTYQPSLPLLKFPAYFGDSWTWQGTTTSYGKSLPATATVMLSRDMLTIGKSVHNTVKIDVSLKLEGSASSTAPVARHLVFWFEAGHGLLQRDFGGISIRKPAW